MIQTGTIWIPFLFLIPPFLPDMVVLLIGGGCAFLFAYLLTFGVRAFSHKVGWLDYPAARRVHVVAVPRLGGVAIFLAFVLASLLFYTPGSTNEVIIYWLLLAAATLMVLVHAYDDVLGLKPWPKMLAETLAVIIILGPWSGVFHGILLFTFNNPFSRAVMMQPGLPWYWQPTLFLFIHPSAPDIQPAITFVALPAVLLTWFWVVGMMNTVNMIDGLDGLATGVVGIAGLFITLISFILGQQSIAVLAAIFTGAVLGFLPHNWNPAKIFMGDTGSVFLGLGLAVLAVMGGAKLAMALMVLGVPILDVAVVIINRVRRGQSPLHYDMTHLHHRLLATGLSIKQICAVIYGLSLLFGLLALLLSGFNNAHLLKFIGVILVGITMAAMIFWIDYRQRQRGARIQLGGGPELTSPTGQETEQGDSDDASVQQEQDTFAEHPVAETPEPENIEQADEVSQPQPDLPHGEHSRARLPL